MQNFVDKFVKKGYVVEGENLMVGDNCRVALMEVDTTISNKIQLYYGHSQKQW